MVKLKKQREGTRLILVMRYATGLTMDCKNNGTIAYVMNRFPILSETFVLREIEALSRLGFNIQPYSLRRIPPHDAQDALMKRWCQRTVYLSSFFYPSNFHQSASLLAAHSSLSWRYAAAEFRHHGFNLYRLLASFFLLSRAALLTHLLCSTDTVWIHAHFGGKATTVAWLAHALSGVPFSFTPHAFELYSKQGRDHLLTSKIRAARFVVAISRFNREALRRIVSDHEIVEDRFPIIHCGVGEDFLDQAVLPREKKVVPLILSVGRLVEKKGHKNLMQALRFLISKHYVFQCIVVGDGPLRKSLQNDIESYRMQQCVKLAGSLPQPAVRALLDRADIFCLPCVIASDGDQDGLPVVLIEALARGVPTVSTCVAGIPELISDGQNGLLVPPGDVPALAEALKALIEKPLLRQRFSEEGRKTAEVQFNLKVEARKLAQCFARGISEMKQPADITSCR